MRYINMVKLLRERDDWPPDGWEKRVKDAEKALRNIPAGKTRADVFTNHRDVWSSVKEHFRQIGYDKCWYCETKTHRHRGDMDHHRPKGGVTENKNHPGYWWLAFEWRNWRFSCEMCNSGLTDKATNIVGGKGNSFPLVDGETRRIFDKRECTDYDDLKKEHPLLLDPAHPDEPQLITFGADGKPRPAMKDKTSVEYRRAEVSIRTYHLDHSALNRKRKTHVYHRIRDLVEKIQKHKLILPDNADNDAIYTIIEDALSDLREMIASDAEYSSAAKAYLRKYRRWAWVDFLLTAS